MKVYYFKEDLRNVTEMYYSVILSALKHNGNEIVDVPLCSFSSARKIPKNSYVLATTLKEFIVLFITGHRNYIYWYQGISPEEVLMMSGSKIRYRLDSFIEKLSLKKVRYKIGVSKYLFNHFEKKYKITINPKRMFIMPCYNSQMKEESFRQPNKYENNVFCYAGGIQPWQGFEDIVNLYKNIEDKRPDVFLKVFSKDKEEARRIVEKKCLKNYSIDSIPQDQMNDALAGCKFGFIIRDNTTINNVATPTKLATYLGNGVIPVFSSTIWAFRDLIKKYNYLCCLDERCNEIEEITRFINKKIDANIIYEEYYKIFKEYFNKEQYLKGLREFFSDMYA